MMTIPTSKWMILLYVFVAMVIVLYMTGRKSVHTQIFIPESPKTVWSVLMDTSKISEWNKVLIPIEGKIRTGASVRYEFHQDENTTSIIPATVKQVIDNRLLNQTGGILGILTFDHKYIMEPAENGTQVVIHEDYRGIMVPFWNPGPVEKAYKKLAQDLKNRVIHVAGGLK